MKSLCLILTTCASLAANAQAPDSVRANGARIVQHLQGLSEFGKNPQGGVSRLAYSEADRQGREYAMRLMREAGLDVTIDLAGNIVGSRAGSDSSLKPLVIGSHIDSVPEGGNYDGDVGSLSAIEVAQRLQETQTRLRHPLQVIIFQNEEGGTVGSKAITTGLDEKLLNLKAQSGKTIREGTAFCGGDPNRLAEARRAPGSIAGYFELHIEQGGTLEQQKLNIGVVEGIVGILHSEVTIEGFSNHAGTTPMDQRRDTLLSAARFIEKVNQVVTSIPGRQVGTVGWIRVQPGAYNVIPGKTVLGLELRDLDATKVETMFHRIRNEVKQIGAMNNTTFSFSEPIVTHPALTNPSFQKLIDATAKELGLSTRVMPSGAGHDAQEMAVIGPVGMIFIPSIGGISHSPKEFSTPSDIENGANVLLQTVVKVDRAN
ncbi:MAG TPA: Zn-dependent hydrolase [Candidatus Angelobacter sp.]|nr:Zn-dependent hydrolase [Candidatus Angelobacter sp.]